MDSFSPGAWNKKMEGGFLMKQVSRAKTPPEAMRLREKLREKSELDRKQLVLEMEREQKGEVIHQPAASTKPPTPPNVPKTERLKTPEDRSVDQVIVNNIFFNFFYCNIESNDINNALYK